MKLQIGSFELCLEASSDSTYAHLCNRSYYLEGISYTKGKDKLIQLNKDDPNNIEMIIWKRRLWICREGTARIEVEQDEDATLA